MNVDRFSASALTAAASRGGLVLAQYRGGANAAPMMGAPENVSAREVRALVEDLAAYVTIAGGDWEALASGRPGWAASATFGVSPELDVEDDLLPPAPAECGEPIPYPREGTGLCQRRAGHPGMHRRGPAAVASDEVHEAEVGELVASGIHETLARSTIAAEETRLDALDRLGARARIVYLVDGEPHVGTIDDYADVLRHAELADLRVGREVFRLGASTTGATIDGRRFLAGASAYTPEVTVGAWDDDDLAAVTITIRYPGGVETASYLLDGRA